MFNSISNSNLYAAVRVTSAFAIAGIEASKRISGTGFFVRNASRKLCLVTNRHLFDLPYKEDRPEYRTAELVEVTVDAFVANNGDTNAKPATQHKGSIALRKSPIRFAQNYFEDVACIVNPSLDEVPSSLVRIDFFFEHSLLADDTWIDERLSICDFVAFPGYPPWHDKSEDRPILRTDTVSSDPRANYSDTPQNKGRRIAYEAFSFGGSSGSPLIATQKGFPGGQGIKTTGYREAKVIGVNAGHFSADRITHSGISYFIRSSAVLDLINDA